MLTTKQLKVKVGSIRKDAKSLRGRIQTVLTHGAGHVLLHGDVASLADLYGATVGINRKRMAQYMQENCMVKLQKDGSIKVNKKARKDAGFVAGETTETDADKLIQTLNDLPAWYVDPTETADTVRELDIAKLVEQLDAKIEKAKVDDSVVVKFDRDRVDAAMVRLGALTNFAAA